MTQPDPDYQSWHRASIRRGVVDDENQPTPQFRTWAEGLSARWEISPIKIEGVPVPIRLAVFELEEDLAAYLLTWTEEYLRGHSEFEAAAFYAPYVPLTISGRLPTGSQPTTSFCIRYGNINSRLRVYVPST